MLKREGGGGGGGWYTSLFKARTTSLCSQTSAGAVKRTHRMGTACFVASAIHLLRVSASAFVLSRFGRSVSPDGTTVTLIISRSSLTNSYRLPLLQIFSGNSKAFLSLHPVSVDM